VVLVAHQGFGIGRLIEFAESTDEHNRPSLCALPHEHGPGRGNFVG
ncbi:uncharacterized protein METZ01_LOCUS275305, partial [marine metagenome]